MIQSDNNKKDWMREWCNNGIVEGFSDKMVKILSDRMMEPLNNWMVKILNNWRMAILSCWMRMFEWMNGGVMKEENNKINKRDTEESVEWWNGGMMEVCKDVIIWWQNIGTMK